MGLLWTTAVCPDCGRRITITNPKRLFDGRLRLPSFEPHRPHIPDGKIFDFCMEEKAGQIRRQCKEWLMAQKKVVQNSASCDIG